ncbi:unnamed protein product [Vitrella brassicaformis CCMP3155]|uniref:Uncharacterized protein n=1 Tax=Vitrella brassicaformis (strain CCMP3155) TaxID=1169540 RepID=A0A0G4EUF2_VITBC|nr:unnamed protein product [Vitrella brassicaformis CCMP3155]|eukprot:CEM02279.1 unnamed protein product [Vitrella brassicaformis CCMP3155]
MSGADGSKRQRIDGGFAEDRQMSGMSSQPQMDVTRDASAAGGSLSFDELQRRFSVLLAQLTQVERDVSVAEGSFALNVTPKVPSASSHWSTLKSSISAASGALTAITQGMAATRPPPTPPPAPHPSPPGAYAPTHTTHTGAAADYYTKCAYALEHGGAVWCEWPDFIRLADIYKLTPSTGLPLIMSPQWMAAHLPTKADFHTMPLALRQYSTFGHLLNCKGTSLVLTKLDEADDGKKEGGGDGGDGGHPYRHTYDPHNPPIRHAHLIRPRFPSFTAFMKSMVLLGWCCQEGVEVDEREVFQAEVGDGDEGYQRLLTDPIDGHTTIDFTEGNEGGLRLIIINGTQEDDTVAAYLYLADGYIYLFTTEAAIEGQERLDDRYPIALSLARPLLTKHGLGHLIPQ